MVKIQIKIKKKSKDTFSIHRIDRLIQGALFPTSMPNAGCSRLQMQLHDFEFVILRRRKKVIQQFLQLTNIYLTIYFLQFQFLFACASLLFHIIVFFISLYYNGINSQNIGNRFHLKINNLSLTFISMNSNQLVYVCLSVCVCWDVYRLF